MLTAIRQGNTEEQPAAIHSRSDSKPLVTPKLNVQMGNNLRIAVPVQADRNRPLSVSQVRQEAASSQEERTALLGVMAAAAIVWEIEMFRVAAGRKILTLSAEVVGLAEVMPRLAVRVALPAWEHGAAGEGEEGAGKDLSQEKTYEGAIPQEANGLLSKVFSACCLIGGVGAGPKKSNRRYERKRADVFHEPPAGGDGLN